jgi:hypothetical protein
VLVEIESWTRRSFGRGHTCDGNGLVRFLGLAASGTLHADIQRILPFPVNNGKSRFQIKGQSELAASVRVTPLVNGGSLIVRGQEIERIDETIDCKD